MVPVRDTVVVTDKVLASSSTTTRTYRGVQGGVGTGGSTRQSYRYVERTICNDCADARDAAAAELARQERNQLLMRRLGAIGVVGGIGAAAALALNAVPNVSIGNGSSFAVPAYGAETAGNAADAATEPADVASPQPVEGAESEAASSDATPDESMADRAPPSTVATDQSAGAARPTAGDDEEVPDVESAITGATISALETGDRVRWRAAGRKGFAVSSVPTITGDRECRNVDVTEVDYGELHPLSRSTWCRRDDGEWHPE